MEKKEDEVEKKKIKKRTKENEKKK